MKNPETLGVKVDFPLEINSLLKQEELWWRQRAKEHWLQEGDRNTKFFHKCANQKCKASSIYKIVDVDGGVCEDQGTIAQAFIRYYGNLFTTVARTDAWTCLMSLMPCITPETNASLLQPYGSFEKHQGQMDFLSVFSKNIRGIVGPEVSKAAIESLNTDKLFQDIIFTYIVLIPKVKCPVCVTNFPPISLCNVLYKLLSKVLANRLKVILPYLILKNQSAFIQGILISNNILAANETSGSSDEENGF